MAGYSDKKQKTPGRAFRRLCVQTAGSLGVFFLVLTMFQNPSPENVRWQDWIRQSFTTDADFAPVISFFYQLDSPEEAAIRVDAPVHSVQEVMAVPVNGKVMSEVENDEMQMASRFAEGIWISAAPDEPVCAAYSGTVTGLWEEADTCTVEISHANGLITVYGCCAESYVALNEPVKKGQALGHTREQNHEGNFYFAARYLGEPISPLELLHQKSGTSL